MNNLAYLPKIVFPTILSFRKGLSISFCGFLLFFANEVKAKILSIDYILVNDTTRVDQNVSDIDTLDLGQIDKLEIHLRTNSLDGLPVQYKMNTIATTTSQTIYPFIRYTNIPKGIHHLTIWQGTDTLQLAIQCTRPEALFFSAETEKQAVESVWWFQPLLTFCLMLIPFTIVYFLSLDRSRRNLRVEVVRNQIASDLHDDVGVNLSAIKNLTEVFIRKNKTPLTGSTGKIVHRIMDYTEETLLKLQDTVWAINPSHDTIGELVHKMKDFAALMIPAKGMQLQFNNQYNPAIIQKLDMPQRHSMFLMFKEALNNIIKHANAKQVDITISNTKKTIDILIKDDGVGFDMTEKFAGNGLKNFQHRADENFIDFDLKSIKGEGTEIKMVVYSLA